MLSNITCARDSSFNFTFLCFWKLIWYRTLLLPAGSPLLLFMQADHPCSVPRVVPLVFEKRVFAGSLANL